MNLKKLKKINKWANHFVGSLCKETVEKAIIVSSPMIWVKVKVKIKEGIVIEEITGEIAVIIEETTIGEIVIIIEATIQEVIIEEMILEGVIEVIAITNQEEIITSEGTNQINHNITNRTILNRITHRIIKECSISHSKNPTISHLRINYPKQLLII